MKELKEYVYDIPDFPIPGVIFRDITGITQDAEGLKLSIDTLQGFLKDVEFDAIAGTEARGFLFGMPLAYNLGKPFILLRKKGKLPRETVSETYELEYGTATIEMNADAVKKGDRIVLVDDLLATGGTLEACARLIEKEGGVVKKILIVIELSELKGREKLQKYDIDSAVIY